MFIFNFKKKKKLFDHPLAPGVLSDGLIFSYRCSGPDFFFFSMTNKRVLFFWFSVEILEMIFDKEMSQTPEHSHQPCRTKTPVFLASVGCNVNHQSLIFDAGFAPFRKHFQLYTFKFLAEVGMLVRLKESYLSLTAHYCFLHHKRSVLPSW